MRDPHLVAKAEEIVEHMEGWEICYSPNRIKKSIIAENGIYAMKFIQFRDLLRVQLTIHPDLPVDRTQPYSVLTITLSMGSSPASLAKRIQTELVPRIIKQTRQLSM